MNAKLNDEQLGRLIEVLSANREALGWHYSNLKGISLTYYQHKILLEDDAKPFRDCQRRLNPHLY